jgi:3-hydroxyisobutyrate dehydrogenase-like beta-hydroxyacid dehydrogenase
MQADDRPEDASPLPPARVGWLGTGRMGTALASRLLAAGADLVVWNRTPEKTAALTGQGATAVDSLAALAAAADVVFVTVAGPADLLAVTTGPDGLLVHEGARPRVVVDCSTVSPAASATLRERAEAAGTRFLAAPLSGNHIAVNAGRAVFVASGPAATFAEVRPYLERMGRAAIHVGEAEESRLVKLSYNLFLGITAQALAEVLSLAERSGVSRADFLDFFTRTHLASPWIQNRAQAMIDADWTPTFTSTLMRKDLQLGLDEARARETPLPVTSLVHELLQASIARGRADLDFLALLDPQADNAGGRGPYAGGS